MEELILAAFAVIIFLIGMCAFSFVNVLIYRIPRGESFVRGRSHCTACGHELGGFDLVPVLSYLCLGRKCRYCGERISPRYMWVELMGGCLALLAAYVFAFSAWPQITTLGALRALTAFVAMAILAAIALIDSDTMEIPNGLVIALAVPALATFFLNVGGGWIDSLLLHGIGFFAVSLPMLLLAMLISGAFGGGDIKLMAVAGFMLGWKLALVALFAALLIGGVQAIIYRVSGAKSGSDHFAFGPALCVGIVLSMCFGDIALNWYMGFFA